MSSDMVDKWGLQVAENGFAQLPNYLVLINQYIDTESRLPPVELLALLQLASAWWEKDKPPFPSLKTLSVRVGVSERQMQRAINSLEEKNLIRRMKKKINPLISSNSYDLTPLVDFLKLVSEMYETPFKRTILRKNEDKAAARPKKTLRLLKLPRKVGLDK